MHAISDEDLHQTLETVRAHLAPDGIFACDVFAAPPAALGRDPGVEFDPQEMIAPDGRRLIVTETTAYDPRQQLHHVSFRYRPSGSDPGGDAIRTVDLSVRVVFPRELNLWLELAGFEIVGDWDDLDRTKPFTGHGGRRFIEATLRRTASSPRKILRDFSAYRD
ncbi:MAG: hypothetical protein HC923_10180 [Myxococcales bacterium]|nr:hypothetical protein [Myxococcales bacterium]